MAEYHLHAQLIKRSEGRSAVACAAYRAGAKLLDERRGVTWDFGKKPGVVHSEILAPEGAPEWVFDREKLWNHVEWTERYKNAQLAREFDVSLPVELSDEAQLQLARTFIAEQLVARGMVCDFSIHREDPENPHFHVMCTMRELDPGGDGFARTKQRAWNDKGLLLQLRQAWERTANLALAQEGHAARIDHRSYEERGINLEPQPKLFRQPRQAALQRGDGIAERMHELRETAFRNGARIIDDPEIVLRLLTSKQPTFSERELYKLLHRQTEDRAQFDLALAKVRSCPALVQLPRKHGDEQRFSTREVVEAERAILDDAHLLAQRGSHQVSAPLVAQAIALADQELNAGQEHAVRHVTTGSDFAIVEGFAGTGKSTMLKSARLAWEAQGLVVVGGALAGIAAENLQQDSGIASRTLHAWQWRWQVKGEHLTSRHVLVIDEAAMVGTAQFRSVIDEVRRAGAKLVLVGDTQQLQSIEPGAPMRLLKSHYQAAELTTILRQRDHAWQRTATLAFPQGDPRGALEAYVQEERVHACASATAAQEAAVQAWAQDRRLHPSDTALLLAYRRRDVLALNERARAVRRALGELGRDQVLHTKNGARAFAVGDRIFFLKNDDKLGVKNGTLGTIEDMVRDQLVVRLDNGTQIAFSARHYDAIDHGYAGTIHKSQGATIDRTYVLASKYMDASASYVALSRHKRDAHLFYDEVEFNHPDKLLRQLSRQRADRMAHDLLGTSTHPRKLERQLARESSALAVRPADRQAALEAYRLRSLETTKSVGEMIARLPEVQKLELVASQKKMLLAEAERALATFTAAHPHLARFRSGGWQELRALAESSQSEVRDAQAALATLRSSASTLQMAERLADRHNRPIHQAKVEWRRLELEQLSLARQEALKLVVLRENARSNSLQMRLATEQDRGRALVCLETGEIGDHDVFFFRGPANGPTVLATAEQCRELGWSTQPTRGRAGHDLERERER